MPNFPAAPIVANPMQPDNFNYAQAYSTMGQKIGNIAAQGGDLYSKIKAYEQVEAKKKDEKAFRTELLSEVTDLMNKNGYDPKSKEIAAYTILNGDMEEAFQKAVKLKENLAIKEANKFDVLPPWGSKEYATTWAGEMKKRQDKELTEQQVQKMQGAATRGQGESQMATGTLEAPTDASKSALKGLPEELSEWQKVKAANDAEKNRIATLKAYNAANKDNDQELIKIRNMAVNMLTKAEKSPDLMNSETLKMQSKIATAAAIAVANSQGSLTTSEAFDLAAEVLSGKQDGKYAGTSLYNTVKQQIDQEYKGEPPQALQEEGFWKKLGKTIVNQFGKVSTPISNSQPQQKKDSLGLF